jgi:hypothetical protein
MGKVILKLRKIAKLKVKKLNLKLEGNEREKFNFNKEVSLFINDY